MLQLYYSPRIDAFYNLALEEHILRTRQEGTYLLFWQSAPTVVIGRHQNLPEEVNLSYAEKHGIHVVRRSTGGGAVYHDDGNINFSFIAPASQSVEEAMRFFTQPIIAALKTLGLTALLSGRNDIILGDKKVSGNAQQIIGTRILHHGTLLYNSDLSILTDVLNVRSEKLASKSMKSTRSRVTNIAEHIPSPPSTKEFINFFMGYMRSTQNTTLFTLTPEDEKNITTIYKEKYTSWDWNYGKSPKSSLKMSRKFTGGVLDVYLAITKGKISACTFYGDFMALRPVEDIANALVGVEFTPAAVSKSLGSLNNKIALTEYFGSISKEEILQCIFFGQ